MAASPMLEQDNSWRYPYPTARRAGVVEHECGARFILGAALNLSIETTRSITTRSAAPAARGARAPHELPAVDTRELGFATDLFCRFVEA